MEELNIVQETIEVVEPVEVLDSIESVKSLDSKGAAIVATVVVAGLAAGYGLKKLWDKRKSKKTASMTVEELEEVKAEVVNETAENI